MANNYQIDYPQMQDVSGLSPVFQNISAQQALHNQLMQQQNQQPTDPNVMAQVQAIQQTAMAETQRKAEKDKAELQLKAQDMQMINQEKAQKLQSDMVINTENNLTNERIKSAELSHDAQALQHEQVKTAIEAQNQMQSQIGENNV
jgi:hypothetical protein